MHVIERYVADGAELPPLTTDPVRWRAQVVDRAEALEVGGRCRPGTVAVEHMDGSFTRPR